MSTRTQQQRGHAAPAGATGSTAVAEIRKGAIVEAGVSFEEDAGAGFEGATADDFAIPFLQILQGLSPQVKRSDGAYIEGAAEGMVFNTVTRGVIDTEKESLVVIPCAYRHTWVEWRVREKGGGFVREYSTRPDAETVRDEKGRDILPNGNQLNDTRTFYVLIVDADAGTASPAVLSMTSTQIKKAKQWHMQQNLLKLNGSKGPYTPPMYASKWVAATVPESNEKGSWYGWKFEHAGYLGKDEAPLYQMAREFHQSVKTGAVSVDMSRADSDDSTSTTDAATQRRSADPDTGEDGDDAPL